MDDFIERKNVYKNIFDGMAAINKYNDLHSGIDDKYVSLNAIEMAVRSIKENIASIPAADVRPERHGHWIVGKRDVIGHTSIICSRCEKGVATSVPPNEWIKHPANAFCGFCGAKMDE